MNELMKYFNEIRAKISVEKSSLQDKEIPKVLHEFYETIGSVDLPYGRIYNLELAMKNSMRAPFVL